MIRTWGSRFLWIRNVDGTVTVANMRARTYRTYANVGYALVDARRAKGGR